jgi:metal-dependent amidase/aminoacylase/carboxypeptidase family protein
MVEETVKSELGEGLYHAMHNPTMGSEDFSYVLEKVKGAFVFLGTKDKEENHPLHHPCFDFDEKVLPTGAHLLAALALNALC